MYIVIELQKTTDISTLVNSYSNRDQAEQRYHQILVAAAISELPKHAAIILDEDGHELKSECYTHEQEEEEE